MAAFGLKLVLFLMMAQVAIGENPATVNDTAETRLRYMQATGGSYQVQIGERSSQQPVRFRKMPVLRFTNAVSGVVDGGLFIWNDSSDRPVAAAQIFIIPNTDDVWLHEFQSLSTRPLDFRYQGRAAWAPNAGGVTFEPFPNAPKPAQTATARLLQMRRLAGQFSVSDAFEGKDQDRLRLLSTPIARYKDDKTIDGAVFVYSHGTDPELFVILEARRGEKGNEAPSWQVALAPMTSYALKADLNGAEFWRVARRRPPFPVTATFRNFVFPPQP